MRYEPRIWSAAPTCSSARAGALPRRRSEVRSASHMCPHPTIRAAAAGDEPWTPTQDRVLHAGQSTMPTSVLPSPLVPRRDWLRMAGLLAATAVAETAIAQKLPIVYVAPLGDGVAEQDVDFVARSLRAFYAVEVRPLPREALPSSAYYRKRRRYRAERLLSFLRARLPSDGQRILGLTNVDISTTKPPHEDWGILGMATLDGQSCVVSSFRTRRLAKSVEHARIRYGKTCVHEIGHTYGLPHCPTKDCLMHDGEGSVLTTDREYDLCSAHCRPRLIRTGHALSDSADAPWPLPGQRTRG